MLLRKCKALSSLSWRARAWLLPAWLALGFSRLLLRLVPFQRLAPCLGQACGDAPYIPLLTPRQATLAADIGRAVRMAARHTPWASDCLPQALTARALLSVHGIPCLLCLGVRRQPGHAGVEAHAWLVAGPQQVTGGDGFPRFRILGSYVRNPE